MKTKNEVEIILGEQIENYEFSLSKLDKAGKLDQRMLWKLLSLAFKKLEELENNPTETEKLKEEKVGIYNPDIEDFTTTQRRDSDNKPIEYSIPAQEIVYFEPKLANYIKKKLATHLLNKRKITNNYQDEFQAALKEISVTV